MIPLTLAIPERIRCGYDDALYKSTFTLLYFTLLVLLFKIAYQLPILFTPLIDKKLSDASEAMVICNFSHTIILRHALTDNAHDDKYWNFKCSEAGILDRKKHTQRFRWYRFSDDLFSHSCI